MRLFKLDRVKGVTIIDWGVLKVRTNLINRYRFNDLRKLKVVRPVDVVRIIRKRLG